jgi:predicted  nucleic acid-binding Zn-ribbon protein
MDATIALQLAALHEADQRLVSLARRHYALQRARERASGMRDLTEELGREQLRRYRLENERLSDLSWELADLELRLRELREQRADGGDVLLDREVQSLEQRHHQLEDHVLEQMLRTDELGRQSPAAQQQFDRQQAQLNQRERRLSALLARIEGRIAEADARRRRLAGQLPPAVLAHYEALRTSAGGEQLARVQAGRCSACGATISAEPITCPSCGRFLLGS